MRSTQKNFNSFPGTCGNRREGPVATSAKPSTAVCMDAGQTKAGLNLVEGGCLVYNLSWRPYLQPSVNSVV